ncbi:MAG: response regulator transcription factor [Dehalococcoidales bacterium]|nr:response regulator transcription factor [Dehalococcoidales bacterium]
MSGERIKIIKVLLADDHVLIRAGLKALLEDRSDIHVVDEASNGVEAVSSFIKHKPDVVILDISMPVMDGLETCKQLRKIDSEAKILILSVYNEQQYAPVLLYPEHQVILTNRPARKSCIKLYGVLQMASSISPKEIKILFFPSYCI